MQTKLTLRLEDQLIEQAKSYAALAGKSVSQIVADYFKLLTAEKIKSVSPSTPGGKKGQATFCDDQEYSREGRRGVSSRHHGFRSQ